MRSSKTSNNNNNQYNPTPSFNRQLSQNNQPPQYGQTSQYDQQSPQYGQQSPQYGQQSQNNKQSQYGQTSQYGNDNESPDVTANKEVLMKSYENQFTVLKILIGLFLIVGSIINRDYSFISNNPLTFLSESVGYGLVGSLPLIFMEYFRKEPSKRNLLMISVVCFLIMVFFHVTLQLSGIYSYMYVDKDELNREYFKNLDNSNDRTPHDNPHANADKLHKTLTDLPKNKSTKLMSGFNWTSHSFIAILLLIFVGYSFYVSYKVMDFNIDRYDQNGNKYLMFFFELMLFSLGNSIPFFFIAKNREANPKHLSDHEKELKEPASLRTNLLETFLLFVKFFILHIILQLTGFYSHLFGTSHTD
jgi:hypothetical protein